MPVQHHTAKALIKITSTSHSERSANLQFERFLDSAGSWFVNIELLTEPEWETQEKDETSGNSED